MNTLNRLVPPASGEIGEIKMMNPEVVNLGNGLPIYFVHAGQSELIRLEFVFPAGDKYQSQPLVAKTANALIKNGTSTKNAARIAEDVDKYGAFMETEISKDHGSLLVYTLHKHLQHITPVIKELLMDATYPEEEMEIFLKNSKQSFLVNQEKVSFLARNEFRKMIFSDKHPYGEVVVESDYDKLDRNNVLNFYRGSYNLDRCKIYLAGKVDDNTLKLIEKEFGQWPYRKEEVQNNLLTDIFAPAATSKIHVTKKGAIQTAVRLGRKLFTKSHPDYCNMAVLNTVLGDYFGSRLMSNIREDKGYTYGISSGIVSMQDAGFFVVATEVGSEVCNAAVEEIHREITRLRNELIPGDELALVRNYMLGSFMRSIDGAFAQIERFIVVDESGLDMDYYRRYVEAIRTVTPKQLNDLANKYLLEEDLVELTVGER